MFLERDVAIAVAVDPVKEPPWAWWHLVTGKHSVTVGVPGRKGPIRRVRLLSCDRRCTKDDRREAEQNGRPTPGHQWQ